MFLKVFGLFCFSYVVVSLVVVFVVIVCCIFSPVWTEYSRLVQIDLDELSVFFPSSHNNNIARDIPVVVFFSQRIQIISVFLQEKQHYLCIISSRVFVVVLFQ